MKASKALLLGIAVIATTYGFSSNQVFALDDVLVCQKKNTIDYDLPTSHPANRCANQATVKQEINWLTWFSGKSLSPRFHFIDFLELISSDTSKES